MPAWNTSVWLHPCTLQLPAVWLLHCSFLQSDYITKASYSLTTPLKLPTVRKTQLKLPTAWLHHCSFLHSDYTTEGSYSLTTPLQLPIVWINYCSLLQSDNPTAAPYCLTTTIQLPTVWQHQYRFLQSDYITAASYSKQFSQTFEISSSSVIFIFAPLCCHFPTVFLLFSWRRQTRESKYITQTQILWTV